MRGTRGGARPLLLLATGVSMAMLYAGCGDGGDGANAAEPGAATTAVVEVKSYPHDPTAFTQGLLFHQGHLYESTGRYNESTVRKVELETGNVLQRVGLPGQYFGEGLALHNERLFQLTWQQGMGFIYDVGTFQQQGTFPYDGEGWGLTSDGRSLILSDGSNVLRFLDPATFQVERTLEVMDGQEHVQMLNELEWVKGEVWANVWHDKRIARIDPQTGRVKGWLDLSALAPTPAPNDAEAVPNGIAYDPAADRLFVTGKLWPQVFEISVPGLVGAGRVPAQ